jgi:hypothetical protein
MKAWSLALLMLGSSAAFAQTSINLPLPSALADGAPCCGVPTQTAATGFTTDGLYVKGLSEYNYGTVVGKTHHGCANVLWDLSGNLVSVTKFTCTTLPALWIYQYDTFTNTTGYKANTTIGLGGANGGSPSGWYYQPILTTP